MITCRPPKLLRVELETTLCIDFSLANTELGIGEKPGGKALFPPFSACEITGSLETPTQVPQDICFYCVLIHA